VVSHDPVVGTASRGNSPQALRLADALRLEYRPWGIVHYLGGSYSAAGQERLKTEAINSLLIFFPHSILFFGRFVARRFIYGGSHCMLHCKILMFYLLITLVSRTLGPVPENLVRIVLSDVQ
jgi:hypothetical protein